MTKASGKGANISASLDFSKTASAKKESSKLNSIENSEKRTVEENSDILSDGSISSTDIALNHEQHKLDQILYEAAQKKLKEIS